MRHGLSIRQACLLFGTYCSVYYYQAHCRDDSPLQQELSRLASVHNRWGFWMMFAWLRQNDYWDNHKRVYRIYTAMKLNLRRKHKRRLPARVLTPLVQPERPNENWSMDFMHDGLIDGRPFRCFNVIDDFNREVLNITLDKSLSSQRIIRELNQLIQWRGKPRQLRVDNGPEFIAYAMDKWSSDHGIKLVFIQKGKPHQNGYIERFNRTYREEVLDNYAFENLQQARVMTQAWMWVYNNQRPHSSLGYMTPRAFLLKCGKRATAPINEKAFPTFQQDSNNKWENIFLNATN